MTRTEFLDFILNELHDAWLVDPVINPASSAAIAAHESRFGQSELYTAANNPFGVKAGSSWRGPTLDLPTWEEVDGRRVDTVARWRKYESVGAAILDFASIIKGLPWYDDAEEAALHAKDFLEGLRATAGEPGWATDSNWFDAIWGHVIRYDLRRKWEVLKRRAPGTDPAPQPPSYGGAPSADQSGNAGDYGAIVLDPPYREGDAARAHNAIAAGEPFVMRGPSTASVLPLDDPEDAAAVKIHVRRKSNGAVQPMPSPPSGLSREPVALLEAVKVLLTLGSSYGLLELTSLETEQLVGAAGGIYLAASTILTIIQRRFVTPAAAPRLKEVPE